MTEAELRAQQAEADHLIARIDSLVNKINSTIRDNNRLEQELNQIRNEVLHMISKAQHMDQAVNEEMGRLSSKIQKLDIDTSTVFEALRELSTSYFSFKNISAASKSISQYTDTYHTKFSYYTEIRRITLGYVIGLDSHVCSSESMRKKVEKAYLQNTEYWLAYCISAVMLWASDEKEAADRAMGKSLSMNYFNSCLFYLLINLRFSRIDVAKKWYINYLDRVDMMNLGDEWQYLLQAYLSGAFGADAAFQNQMHKCFMDMLTKIQVTHVDYSKNVAQHAHTFAETYLHKTEHEYAVLKKVCAEYEDLKALLSLAEKNAVIAKYYNQIAEKEEAEVVDLPQRIENVLYALINDYDDDELKIVQKLKYNEAIVKAKGDIVAAQATYNLTFSDEFEKKSLADLLINWAFSDEHSQTALCVKRFSISFTKEWTIKGFEQFANAYRKKEQEKYTLTIDHFKIECGEHDFTSSSSLLAQHYNRTKLKDIFSDKFVLIYLGICAASLLTLGVMAFAFSKIALVIGILLGLAGSFLLWRRIVDVNKILLEKMRLGINKLKQALDELRAWRSSYKEEDARHADLKDALERF